MSLLGFNQFAIWAVIVRVLSARVQKREKMPYRFIHAADIHLDSPLKSLVLRDPELAELIGNATRRAFAGIIDLCLAEQVDALLLAGDLYDGDQTSMKTARFLAEQLLQLHKANIKVFIIRGNHDHLSRITKELTFPDSVSLFGGRADAISVARADTDFPVTIHGLSFAQAHAPESLLDRFRRPTQGAVNIALMHTSLAGAPGHDNYAPCSIVDLTASGFDYWALGHIHKRSIVQDRCAIVMSGMPQGRDIGESGAKSVTLVTIMDDRSIQIEERVTSVAQFESVSIGLTGIESWDDMIAAVTKALGLARGRVKSEHLVARLHFTGATPLAWRMRRDPDLLKEEAANRGQVVGKTWIEKVEIDCHAPDARADANADPIIELHRLINEEVMQSDAYRTEIVGIVKELRSQLPPECRDLLGSEDTFDDLIRALGQEGAQDVLARMHASADAGAD
jgi:DNA repair exonuclease SbcCD nuclease subunit